MEMAQNGGQLSICPGACECESAAVATPQHPRDPAREVNVFCMEAFLFSVPLFLFVIFPHYFCVLRLSSVFLFEHFSGGENETNFSRSGAPPLCSGNLLVVTRLMQSSLSVLLWFSFLPSSVFAVSHWMLTLAASEIVQSLTLSSFAMIYVLFSRLSVFLSMQKKDTYA